MELRGNWYGRAMGEEAARRARTLYGITVPIKVGYFFASEWCTVWRRTRTVVEYFSSALNCIAYI